MTSEIEDMGADFGISSRRLRGAGLLITVALLAAACSSSSGGVEIAQRRVDAAKTAVAEANDALEQAGGNFCEEATDYIVAIDRYGKVFNDDDATVGDVQTRGADLAAPRESTAAAAQAVLDAHDAVNTANQELADAKATLAEAKVSVSGSPAATAKPTQAPALSAPSVPPASVERVKKAEQDLQTAIQGVAETTTIVDAGESFTAAAFALEVAWLNLFADAGCLTDEQSQAASDAIRTYTAAVQEDLKTAGYLSGQPDGVYGPETVAAIQQLQADSGLPTTGLLDDPTRDALAQAVTSAGASSATEETVEATAVQTVLKLAGYWPGAVDGQWTPELEDALKDLQRALGVEPTGAVDAATLAALQDALVELSAPDETPSPVGSASDSTSASTSG